MLLRQKLKNTEKTQFSNFSKCLKFKTCHKFQIMLKCVLKCSNDTKWHNRINSCHSVTQIKHVQTCHNTTIQFYTILQTLSQLTILWFDTMLHVSKMSRLVLYWYKMIRFDYIMKYSKIWANCRQSGTQQQS